MQGSVSWLSEYGTYFPMKCFESFLFLSSSPRPLARKGKPTNAILWITLTAHSLGSQHCNMELYSINELTDMHLVYGAAYQSERIAARMYVERFPQRRHPSHTMFQRFDQRLRERGSLRPDMSETGRPRSLTPDVEEAILGLLEDEPAISSREIAHHVELNQSNVLRFFTSNYCITFIRNLFSVLTRRIIHKDVSFMSGSCIKVQWYLISQVVCYFLTNQLSQGIAFLTNIINTPGIK